MTTDVKYPNIEVKLVGKDGNAFSIMGRVTREMRRGGVPMSEIEKFTEECMSGDYDNLLRTCMDWVSVK
jgi:hypothetical protein